MLQAHVLPSEGGGTIFANQHLAYDTLPEELRSQLDGAKAWNSGKAFGPNMPDTLQPAIRTHDETGRKALYLNPVFTTEIDGLDQTTSRELILRAVQHGCRGCRSSDKATGACGHSESARKVAATLSGCWAVTRKSSQFCSACRSSCENFDDRRCSRCNTGTTDSPSSKRRSK